MIRTSEPSSFDTTKLIPITKEIILYVDTPLLTQRPSGTLIYLQLEPEAIIRAEDYLVKNYKLYDYLSLFMNILNGKSVITLFISYLKV